MLTEKYTVDGL